MSSNVMFAFVVMLAVGAMAAPADESSPKEKRGLLGSLAYAHAPIAAYHAPLSYGLGLHAPLAYHAPILPAYHAPALSAYHAPLLSAYHHPIW